MPLTSSLMKLCTVLIMTTFPWQLAFFYSLYQTYCNIFWTYGIFCIFTIWYVPAAFFVWIFLWSSWLSLTLPQLVCLAYVHGFYFLCCCIMLYLLCCFVLHCIALCCLCFVALHRVVSWTSSAFVGVPLCWTSRQTEKISLTGRQSQGGGNPLFKLYRYVGHQRVWFLSLFGLK